MEPVCANLLHSRVAVSPFSSSPCTSEGSLRNAKASPSSSLLQGSAPIRASISSGPPALATAPQGSTQICTHLCSAQNFAQLSEPAQSLGGRPALFIDLGWFERIEFRDFQSHPLRRRPWPTNIGSSRALFDSLKGYWCRDCRRAGSALPSSCASTSSGDSGRIAPLLASRKSSRTYRCRSGSRDSSDVGGGGGGGAGEGENCERPGGNSDEEGADATGSTSASTVSSSGKLDQPPTEIGTLESELFLYTGRMRALKNFREEVAKPDEEINLVRAAVFVAQHLYPRISAEEVEAELDEMAAALEPALPPPPERYTMRMINSINNYLYGELGFKGADVYLDPDNSCLNMVLKRRQGLPLTMSLVYMELAKRVGLPMQGVNLPAHFMCRPTGDGLEFFIDAHAKGKITFLQDAEDRLSVVYGVPVAINPEFLKHTAITNRAFLLRLLFNLKRIYFERKDPVSTLCIIDYLKIVQPGVIEEVRDYGICLYLLNRFSEAIPCLESYLQEAPRATDAESMRTLLFKMRQDL